MPDATEVLEWRGRTAVDPDGAKLGKIEEIYLDAETRHALGIKTTAERTAEVNGTAEPVLAEPDDDDAPPAPVQVELQQRPATPAAPPTAPTPAPATVSQAPAFTPGMAAVDAPYCSTCGVRMRPAGSCFVCESCGTTSGCS